MILEAATLSFSKSISFPEVPSGFKVSYIGAPEVPVSTMESEVQQALDRGKKEATLFYKEEIQKLRDEIGQRQTQLLSQINQKVDSMLNELENRLPDLVIGIAERVLGQIDLDGEKIEEIVKSMISEFSEEDEKLEVYLSPSDLELLKGLRRTNSEDTNESEGSVDSEEGFASAIAGIFDGLDGDDALLSEYPEVKFFEDDSLHNGDCQIKSRYGLLDGRISTKIRKIEEELKGND